MIDESDIARIEEARSQITSVLSKMRLTKFEATALLEQIKCDLVWYSYIREKRREQITEELNKEKGGLKR